MFNLLFCADQKPTAAWVKGTELIAWDSSVFKAGGFTDYVGRKMATPSSIASTTAVPAVAPSLANEDFKYGKCVNLGNGSVCTVAGQVSQNVFTQPWSLDYWTRDTLTLDPANQYNSVTPLAAYPDMTVGTWTNRVLMALCYGNTKRRSSLWNNAASPRVTGTVNADPAFSTAFHHVAITYDGSRVRWFINGVLIEALVWTMLAPTSAVQIGPLSYVWLNSPRPEALVERYRFRSGVAFASAGFDPATIYN